MLGWRGFELGGCIVLLIQISCGKTSESFIPTPRMGTLGHIALISSPGHCMKVALGRTCLQLSKFSDAGGSHQTEIKVLEMGCCQWAEIVLRAGHHCMW